MASASCVVKSLEGLVRYHINANLEVLIQFLKMKLLPKYDLSKKAYVSCQYLQDDVFCSF